MSNSIRFSRKDIRKLVQESLRDFVSEQTMASQSLANKPLESEEYGGESFEDLEDMSMYEQDIQDPRMADLEEPEEPEEDVDDFDFISEISSPGIHHEDDLAMTVAAGLRDACDSITMAAQDVEEGYEPRLTKVKIRAAIGQLQRALSMLDGQADSFADD